MKAHYVQALLASLRDGMSAEVALTGLTHALQKKHHEKLLAPVLLEVVRVLEAEKGVDTAEVRVAKAADLHILKSQIDATLQVLGATTDTTVKEVVDETVVGGFVATYNYHEQDKSYKKALKSLYESITK